METASRNVVLQSRRGRRPGNYCFSYSPLPTRLRPLKPAFFASEIETVLGELKVENRRRTGFLQAGHWVKGAAERGRRKVNFPPHTLQSPSHNSYSYNGMSEPTLTCPAP